VFVPNQNGMIIPEVPKAAGGGVSQVFHNVIDARGADPASITRLERAVQSLNVNQARQAKAMTSAQRYQSTGVM
jgi:hypothetical protein